MNKPVIIGNQEDKPRLETLCGNSSLDFVYTAQRITNPFVDRAILIGGKAGEFYKVVCDYVTGRVLRQKQIELDEVEPHAKSFFNRDMWLRYGF
jgi:hypothetical protein